MKSFKWDFRFGKLMSRVGGVIAAAWIGWAMFNFLERKMRGEEMPSPFIGIPVFEQLSQLSAPASWGLLGAGSLLTASGLWLMMTHGDTRRKIWITLIFLGGYLNAGGMVGLIS